METKRIMVTGGAGFIGSTVSERLLKEGYEVVVFDNFIRNGVEFNINRLKDATIIRGDIRFPEDIKRAGKIDGIYHCAANPGIKMSINYPLFDFETNAKGTLNILEYARKYGAFVIYSSTNKVYSGSKVNSIPIIEKETRYEFADPKFKGIPETFGVDGSDHSLYGVSKLAGDNLCQEYSSSMGVPAIVNRMSCIAGKWQLGVEDQGWVSWFVYAAKIGRSINIYGNGKQVRDVLHSEDLATLILLEIKNMDKLKTNVFNVGGGINNTMSVLECIRYLESKLGIEIPLCFKDWRVADQKVYISDITKISKIWKPVTKPFEIVDGIVSWFDENEEYLKQVKLDQ
jgi:CDP-paratose 2-epimerase